MRADCHPNRHFVNSGREDCISTKIDHKPMEYFGTVMLSDVNFVVHKSGVQRARRNQQRNVHAWARGTVIHTAKTQLKDFKVEELRKVTYYYQEGYFRDFETHEKVTHSKFVVMNGRDCFYLPE